MFRRKKNLKNHNLLLRSVERREVPRDPVHEAEQPGRTAGRRLPGTNIF